MLNYTSFITHCWDGTSLKFKSDNIVLIPNCLELKQWNKIFRKFTFDFDTNSSSLPFYPRDIRDR